MAKDEKPRRTTKDPAPIESQTVGEVRPKKIMIQPLPQILDEIEDSIKLADEAARDARKAAEEARQAGERAAAAVKEAAEEAVAKVRDEAAKAIDTMGIRVAAIESEINALKERLSQEALAVDWALLAAKDKHLAESPFLQG